MSSTEQVSELLLRWDELRGQGRDVAAEELCRDCPELTAEVRRRIEALRAVYGVPNDADPESETLAEETAPPAAPPTVPGYEIHERLGSGGMGIVYRARQVRLKRTVALKMILSGAHATPSQQARFRVEAEAAARLQHPNIVQIYEVGEHGGVPYLALEYVSGGSLADRLAGTPLPPHQAAELVRSLALAIQHAHERGVVHRDLKPANVLLSRRASSLACPGEEGKQGCLPYESEPKVTDFGLAKCLDEGAQTQTGAVLGTPAYMAPEQAAGQTAAVGPAADVYALGVILYECLTGRPPFQAATVLETLEQVRSHAPPPPHLLQPQLPQDLETICLKCLRKEPRERYDSALALAEDLARFLQGEPIRARPVSLLDQLARLLNRESEIQPGGITAKLLFLIAPAPFLAQLLLLAVLGGQPSYGVASLALTLLVVFTMVGIVLLMDRRLPVLKSPVTNRVVWAARIGMVTAMVVAVLLSYLLTPAGREWDALAVYPLWTLLVGTTIFSVAGLAWGRLYLLGAAFMAASVVMALWLPWAPPAFGFLISLMGLAIAMRLRRLTAGSGAA